MPSTDQAMANLESSTAAIEGVVPSVVNLLNGFAAIIKENADDPEQINAIATRMQSQGSALAAAVAEHSTPA